MRSVALLVLALFTFGIDLAGKPAPKKELQANLNTQLERLTAADKAADPAIMLYTFDLENPDSAGGVDATIGFKVTGKKAVKYAYFSVTVLNRVGDPATCQIRRTAQQRLEYTGPAESGSFQSRVRFRGVVYNSTASFLRIDSVKVILMDGTEVTYTGDTLPQVLTCPAANDFAANVQQRILTRVSDSGRFDLWGKEGIIPSYRR